MSKEKSNEIYNNHQEIKNSENCENYKKNYTSVITFYIQYLHGYTYILKEDNFNVYGISDRSTWNVFFMNFWEYVETSCLGVIKYKSFGDIFGSLTKV